MENGAGRSLGCTEVISRFSLFRWRHVMQRIEKGTEWNISFIYYRECECAGYAFRASCSAYKTYSICFENCEKRKPCLMMRKNRRWINALTGILNEAVKAWDIALPPDSDKQNHSVEISIPALDPESTGYLFQHLKILPEKPMRVCSMSYQQYWLVQTSSKTDDRNYLSIVRTGNRCRRMQATAFCERVQLHCKKIHHQTSRDLYVRWKMEESEFCSSDNYRVNFNLNLFPKWQAVSEMKDFINTRRHAFHR